MQIFLYLCAIFLNRKIVNRKIVNKFHGYFDYRASV